MKAPLPVAAESGAKSSKRSEPLCRISQAHYRLPSAERQAEMNVLTMEKQVQIITALVEGNSVRATARMVGVEHKTVLRVLLRAGDRCGQILNEQMRRLPCRIVQMDEIWTFVAKKEKRVTTDDDPTQVGDQYVFVAMDPESKLIVSVKPDASGGRCQPLASFPHGTSRE